MTVYRWKVRDYEDRPHTIKPRLRGEEPTLAQAKARVEAMFSGIEWITEINYHGVTMHRCSPSTRYDCYVHEVEETA